MVRKTFAGLVAALCFAATSPASAAAADCRLTLLASADIVFNPGGGVLVPVRMGTRDVWMVLQMSSGLAMIHPEAVTLLGLKTNPVRTDIKLTSGNVPIEREVEPESMLIGNANFAGWKLYVQPGPQRPLSGYQGRPVIGALSSNFMNAVDMELDLARRKMNLFRHARCRGEQVYWSDAYTKEYLYVDPAGLLYFPLELEGKRVETSLNTQGPRSRLSEQVARQYFSFKRDPAEAPAAPAPPGALPLVGVRSMGLTARELALPDAQVHIFDDRRRDCETDKAARGSNAISFRTCFGIVPFEMGTDLLQHLRFYIASEEKMIYITRNAPDGAAAAGGGAGAGAAAAAPAAADGANATGGAPPAAGSPAAPGAGEPAPTQ